MRIETDKKTDRENWVIDKWYMKLMLMVGIYNSTIFVLRIFFASI